MIREIATDPEGRLAMTGHVSSMNNPEAKHRGQLFVKAEIRNHQNTPKLRKNPLFLTGFVLLWIVLNDVLVEAAGVEPASENIPLQFLRTYPLIRIRYLNPPKAGEISRYPG
jgi:hypothetical protein